MISRNLDRSELGKMRRDPSWIVARVKCHLPVMKSFPALANLDRVHGSTAIKQIESAPDEHFPLNNITDPVG